LRIWAPAQRRFFAEGLAPDCAGAVAVAVNGILQPALETDLHLGRQTSPACTRWPTFGEVLREWRKLLGQHMRTTFVSQGSSVLAPVIPIILAAPKFLDGSMTFGQVMQAASAFTIVQAAFGWLVDNYPRLADWSAGARL
jgi:hypothetical protein